MVTGVQEEIPYSSHGTSSGKQKKARSTSQPQFRSEKTPATIEADQILLAFQQMATNNNSVNFNNNINRFSKLPKSLTTTMPTFDPCPEAVFFSHYSGNLNGSELEETHHNSKLFYTFGPVNRHQIFVFGVMNLMANYRYRRTELTVVKHACRRRLICTLICLDERFHQFFSLILFFLICEPKHKTSDLSLKAQQLKGGISAKFSLDAKIIGSEYKMKGKIVRNK